MTDREIERELTELGAEPDPELAAVVAMVEQTFPDAQFLGVEAPEEPEPQPHGRPPPSAERRVDKGVATRLKTAC